MTFFRWFSADGKVLFKDTSSNGTFCSRDDTSQESFSRLPKGEMKELQIGDYVMFSQWSNNRTNEELLMCGDTLSKVAIDVAVTSATSAHRLTKPYVQLSYPTDPR